MELACSKSSRWIFCGKIVPLHDDCGAEAPQNMLLFVSEGCEGNVERAYSSHLGLLGTRSERPCRGRAADKANELAPSHSITSSARASGVGGTSSPSALAAWRLIASRYLVGVCTGRSAGF